MFNFLFIVVLLLINEPTVGAHVICIVEDKTLNVESSSYKAFSCERCCEQGCCPIENPPELTLQVGTSGEQFTFVWILGVLIMLGYICLAIYYCGKKRRKRTRLDTASVINRCNTQPQEISLMLSINQNRDGLERFHFENLNTHFSVPLTPITPPPAYVTPTPPPNYNVAIHFPPIYTKQNLEQRTEVVQEVTESVMKNCDYSV